MLVVKDTKYKAYFAYCVPRKGAADDWIVTEVVKDIERLGNRDIILKSDGENAIRELQEKVRRRRADATVLENPPVGDSQANGFIENANGIIKTQVREMKDALDTRLGEKLPPDSPVITWLVQYAAVLWSRYAVSKDGKTAYERIRGKQCVRPIAEFGERIHYRPLKGDPVRENKLEEGGKTESG